jgi:Protein of unknown function (DUF2934)
MIALPTLSTPERRGSNANHARYVLGHEHPVMDHQPPQDALARAISEVAYHRAEMRGFAPGHEMEDWIEAERHVTGMNDTDD